MATYPETPVPVFPAKVTPKWNTLIATTDASGVNEQRRGKQLFPKYDITYAYESLSPAEFQTLWAFYMASKGAYESFYAYDRQSMAHDTPHYCGTADGDIGIFDIPGKGTSLHTVYLGGIAQNLTTDYTILTGGGESNADRISFIVPPVAGQIVSVTFTGYLRIKGRFKSDRLTREDFRRLLINTGVEVYGL